MGKINKLVPHGLASEIIQAYMQAYASGAYEGQHISEGCIGVFDLREKITGLLERDYPGVNIRRLLSPGATRSNGKITLESIPQIEILNEALAA